jgi:hypothetical protein
MRAKDDPEHKEFIDDLHRGGDICPETVFQLYKPLTKEDVKDDEDWRFATVIVATNRERHDINLAKSQEFARTRGVPVVRWRKTLEKWPEKPEEDMVAQDAAEDSYFWHYFIPGADGYCSVNLSVGLQLANGAPVRLHSLSFADAHQEKLYLAAVNDPECKPGAFVTLEKPPLSVNVIPWPDQGKDHHAQCHSMA